MKLVIALNFIVLAIVMVGLFFIARANYGRLGQSSKYWSIAIATDALGMALTGALFLVITDFRASSPVGTVSNTLLFASILYQSISIKALNSEITKKIKRYLLLSIASFAVLWNFARLNTDINIRVMVFAVFALIALIWQLIELNKHSQASQQIRIIRVSVMGEIVFTIFRFFAVSEVSEKILYVEELPIVGLFALWVQYGLKIVVYAGLVAFWSEELAEQKAKIEIEKQAFKALSEAQEQLIADLGRLNKAATTGLMAASIAHELSQPLQSLVLNIGVSQQEMKAGNPNYNLVTELLQEQSYSVNKMVEVIGTMRGMFTEGGTKEEQVDLFELIQKLTVFINPQAHERGIQVDYFNDKSAVVCVRSAELQQAILNLIANAFDALDGFKGDAKKVKISVIHGNEQITCCVEDSGNGIADDMYDQVFKFLKTTKSTGMGLGLWLTKYIIEKNHGQITAGKSALGGAMFTIKLPSSISPP